MPNETRNRIWCLWFLCICAATASLFTLHIWLVVSQLNGYATDGYGTFGDAVVRLVDVSKDSVQCVDEQGTFDSSLSTCSANAKWQVNDVDDDARCGAEGSVLDDRRETSAWWKYPQLNLRLFDFSRTLYGLQYVDQMERQIERISNVSSAIDPFLSFNSTCGHRVRSVVFAWSLWQGAVNGASLGLYAASAFLLLCVTALIRFGTLLVVRKGGNDVNKALVASQTDQERVSEPTRSVVAAFLPNMERVASPTTPVIVLLFAVASLLSFVLHWAFFVSAIGCGLSFPGVSNSGAFDETFDAFVVVLVASASVGLFFIAIPILQFRDRFYDGLSEETLQRINSQSKRRLFGVSALYLSYTAAFITRVKGLGEHADDLLNRLLDLHTCVGKGGDAEVLQVDVENFVSESADLTVLSLCAGAAMGVWASFPWFLRYDNELGQIDPSIVIGSALFEGGIATSLMLRGLKVFSLSNAFTSFEGTVWVNVVFQGVCALTFAFVVFDRAFPSQELSQGKVCGLMMASVTLHVVIGLALGGVLTVLVNDTRVLWIVIMAGVLLAVGGAVWLWKSRSRGADQRAKVASEALSMKFGNGVVQGVGKPLLPSLSGLDAWNETAGQ